MTGTAAVTGLVGLQVLFAVTLWVVGQGRAKTLEEERTASRGETLLDLGHSLEPLTRELARMSALNIADRRLQLSGMRQAVLGAASGLSEEHLRACYFALEEEDGVRVLRFRASTGRSSASKNEFRAVTVAGDSALTMVDDGEHLFCDDVQQSAPPGREQSEHGEYLTFISVTVGTPGRPRGMLTLDAVALGSLTAEDVRMLVVPGHMLGLSEQMCA